MSKVYKVSPGRHLQPNSVETEEWFTGKMAESVVLYPTFKQVEGKAEDTIGKTVCMVPEIRQMADLAKEAQFTIYHTTKARGQISRDEYLRTKGFIPLSEADPKIKAKVTIMRKHNQEELKSRTIGGREIYQPKKEKKKGKRVG